MQLDFVEQTKFQEVSKIVIPDIFYNRLKSGIKVIDDLFGDGILPGGTFTFTAPPGCGKTTFMLQVLNALALEGYSVGYASGEENIYQLAYTAKRLNCNSVHIANITNVDTLKKLAQDLDILVVDSFQSATTTVKMNYAQRERYVVSELVKQAKKLECALGFIVHLTKTGQIKGSTLIPHTVDANFSISIAEGGEESGLRIISSSKNRFGPLKSVQLYMTSAGYDFSTIVTDNAVNVSGKSTAINAHYNKILSLPKINMQTVCDELQINVVKAGTLLRELTKLGKLVKIGRGDNAAWNVVKKVITVGDVEDSTDEDGGTE